MNRRARGIRISKAKGGAFKRLKDLGQERLEEIDQRLLAGEVCSAIATLIQSDWGELKDIQTASLKKTLERYRETELREKTLARIAGAQQGSALKIVQQRLNAMDEMEVLVRQQRTRVDKLLMREEQMAGAGLLLKDTTREIGMLKDMLFDLGKIQLETGLLQRAPKTIKGTMTDASGQVREFEWTSEQEELFRTIEQVEAHERD